MWKIDSTNNETNYLFISSIITIGIQMSCFLISFICQFDKITDFAGSFNFLLIAVLTFILNGTYYKRQIIITIMIILWASRLGLFLLLRVLKRGKDSRFDEMRSNFFKFFGFWTFQIFWIYLCSLPVIFTNGSIHDTKLNYIDYIGWILWSTGFIIETFADYTKNKFINEQSNNNNNENIFLNQDLWKYSRHPNYFGEILCWIGIFISSISVYKNNTKWGYISILSPLMTITILLFLSGIPLAEDKSDLKYSKNPKYKIYKNETSPLIPLPNNLYSHTPYWIKKLFFCEFDMYSRIMKKEETKLHENKKLK